ncbi:hypothetical protein CVT25_014035 [Psilocybe cyanescens]|uniref:Uncharacterized protein n=1 Tax=Psilocybe cyanescens TaxID=93625 RepID=A0A409XJW6_PSICY|nr:hypothetical protein CVT25_014035 [Psilocybe cyanescens]
MTLGALFTSQDEWFYNYNRRRSLFFLFTVFTIWGARLWSSIGQVGANGGSGATAVGTTTTSDPFVFFIAFRRSAFLNSRHRFQLVCVFML